MLESRECSECRKTFQFTYVFGRKPEKCSDKCRRTAAVRHVTAYKARKAAQLAAQAA